MLIPRAELQLGVANEGSDRGRSGPSSQRTRCRFTSTAFRLRDPMGSRGRLGFAAVAVALATASPADGAIRLFHDSFDSHYRSPFGAVAAGSKVTAAARDGREADERHAAGDRERPCVDEEVAARLPHASQR